MQVEAQSLRMPLRFLARLRQLLEAPVPTAPTLVAPVEAVALNGAANINGAAPLDSAASVSAASTGEHVRTLESRQASGAAASTSTDACSRNSGSPTTSAQEAPMDAELAAAVAEIQSRRCPPLGRFGHGTSYNVRVTKRTRTLPFSVKVRDFSHPHVHALHATLIQPEKNIHAAACSLQCLEKGSVLVVS